LGGGGGARLHKDVGLAVLVLRAALDLVDAHLTHELVQLRQLLLWVVVVVVGRGRG
jgi:hypothetical protein